MKVILGFDAGPCPERRGDKSIAARAGEVKSLLSPPLSL
jgi:hypothetical protein